MVAQVLTYCFALSLVQHIEPIQKLNILRKDLDSPLILRQIKSKYQQKEWVIATRDYESMLLFQYWVYSIF